MAVTNYYSVNGQIIGEATNGVRTDYLMDALGSVTGTVNSACQVVNTYRYKPYGSLLSKTGVGTDPAFGWVGTQGYKQTQKKFSDFYVRARHYDSGTARWTTKDPIGFEGGDLNLYRYVSNRVVISRDPSGLIVIDFDSCGTTDRKLIQQHMDAICANQNYLDCLDNFACKTKYPGGGGLGSTIEECINAWCANTKKNPLKIVCCKSGPCRGRCTGTKNKDVCGSSLPGSGEIHVCIPEFYGIKKPKCPSPICTLAHELIHLCGQVGHPKPNPGGPPGSGSPFDCVTQIPGC